MLFLLLDVAFGCGQTTHIWTALHGVEHLDDGPLKQLLSSAEGRRALVSGTMFPDGGYSPTVNHPYGEAAHWEPFQDRYLAWVRSQEVEEPRHRAFLYGLAAHGLGDQLFDAAYLTRAAEQDGVTQSDTVTDIVVASEWGGHPQHDHWVPNEVLIPLFADAALSVDEATLNRGMASLDLAVFAVGAAGANPEAVEQNRAAEPWATSHLTQPGEAGAPACLGKWIADYWEGLELRLEGSRASEVIGVTPGPFLSPGEGRSVLLSVVFGRAVQASSIEGRVHLAGPSGPVPIEARMYYGDASNVLNVQPLEPLVADQAYTLSLDAGILDLDGQAGAGWEAALSTAEPPVTDVDADPADDRSCGCATPTEGAWGWFFRR